MAAIDTLGGEDGVHGCSGGGEVGLDPGDGRCPS